MARQLVVLDAYQSAGNYQVRAAYWLSAPATRVVPIPSALSQVPGVLSTELMAIRAGSVVEQISTISVAAGSSAAQIQTALQTQYATLQATLNSQVFASSHLVGASWDGTTWTLGP